MNTTPEYIHSELPAIQQFQALGYTYLEGTKIEERATITEVILEKRLKSALKRINPWMNENSLNKAFDKITTIEGTSLMEINQKAWNLLKGGTETIKQKIGEEEAFKAIHYIDYENINNNEFLVVNQLKYYGTAKNSIPDIVIYVNGLPLAVIECKSPKAENAWDKAYGDLDYYQKNSEKLFHYNQICVGIWKDLGKYGAIEASQQFYSVFKTAQDKIGFGQEILLENIFQKERFLDIIRHFVIFELEEGRTIKKLPRYQQLRATNKTIAKLQKGEGGVVWHTQGSGKSITMAYVTRKLQSPEYGFDNPTVLIMTDRKDLDQQITDTFHHIGFKNVNHAHSVKHLDGLLQNSYGGIITSTLQKFQESNQESSNQNDQTSLEEQHDKLLIEKNIEGNILTKITKVKEENTWVEISKEEIELTELSNKENLYILVDEAHRSHYGFLASFMRTVLPNAKFVAFTGTPISKEDKSTLGEFYGGKDYIDVYTIKEAVADGATVELLYDEGIAKLDVKKEELDKEFEETFAHESEEKKEQLKREALKKYQLSTERIEVISKHIISHFQEKIYKDEQKAMIVCRGRASAIRYQEAFQKLQAEGFHDFTAKTVISLGSPKSDSIAKEYYETLKWNQENPSNKKNIFVVPTEEIKMVTNNFKLPFGNESETEKSGKKKYDNTAFLIVSDMLLTGYDAPIASCLYLDKPLKEHNLLQAIARVNRSRKGKNAGFIIDYNGITADLIQALEIFSGDLKVEDVLRDLNQEIPKLEANHTKMLDFFKPMNIDRNYEREKYKDTAIQFLEAIDKRDEFKAFLKDFNKSINIVLPHKSAMKYQADFKMYNEISLRARNTYMDDGLKISKDESKMLQELIDQHLKAEGVENLLAEPVSIIDREQFKKEMENLSPATKELKIRNSFTPSK